MESTLSSRPDFSDALTNKQYGKYNRSIFIGAGSA